MKIPNGSLFLAAAALLAAGAVAAADNEAGVPLSPAEAAGGWTVEDGSADVCMLKLTADHGAAPSQGCANELPAGVTGWKATNDGMALTDASGQTLLSFGRWSNSLFVAHRSSGTDLRLMRGHDPAPGTSTAGVTPGPRPYD
jgi:protease inhibitor Inh